MKKNIAETIRRKTYLTERLHFESSNKVWKSGIFYNRKFPNSGLLTEWAIDEVLEELNK
jgi:hypothetical protein